MPRTGRPPKPEGQKVNRHPPTHAPVALPEGGREGPAPKPALKIEGEAKRLWTALWKLPEAAMWTDADLPPLTRLVCLQASPHAWMDSRLLAEMRQLEDRFGMNPTARRQLGWHVANAAEEKTETPERTPEDRRSRLKVV